jgi:hypothetical protein
MNQLMKLESLDWSNLTDAYGAALRMPTLLSLLNDFPAGDRYEQEPWFSLWSALYHQGEVYSASFAAVPFIVNAAERDPSRATFNYFTLPTAIEIARAENQIQVPEELKAAYFDALAKLPGLALPLLRPGCDATLCQYILAALAAAAGQHGYAKLLSEIDSRSVPKTLACIYDRDS